MSLQRDNKIKRSKARYLVTVKGYSQKETAKIVGVSEPTISKWATKYEWRSKSNKMVSDKGGVNSIIEGFFKYVTVTTPELIKAIKKQWTNFLKAYEKDIGS